MTDTSATKQLRFFISLNSFCFFYEGKSQLLWIKNSKDVVLGGTTFASWHFLHFLMDWFVILDEHLNVLFEKKNKKKDGWKSCSSVARKEKKN